MTQTFEVATANLASYNNCCCYYRFGQVPIFSSTYALAIQNRLTLNEFNDTIAILQQTLNLIDDNSVRTSFHTKNMILSIFSNTVKQLNLRDNSRGIAWNVSVTYEGWQATIVHIQIEYLLNYAPPPFIPQQANIQLPQQPIIQHKEIYYQEYDTDRVYVPFIGVTKLHSDDATRALIIFCVGFLFFPVWFGAICFIKSKDTTARVFGILSLVLAIGAILAIVLIIIPASRHRSSFST